MSATSTRGHGVVNKTMMMMTGSYELMIYDYDMIVVIEVMMMMT